MHNLTIIVPVYNEAEVLPGVLPGLLGFCREKGCRLVLVNDGSKDGSLAILREHTAGADFAKVVSHKVNRGYGGALKSGIRASETEYSIFVDADGQHRLEDVANLYRRTVETDADMIVGSRKGQKGSPFRSLGKFFIRRIAKTLMNVPIYDINSGMKIFRTELARKYMPLYPDGMAFSDIICLVFLYDRNLVLEEPIRVEERKGGKSTIGLHTAISTVYEILNIVTLFNPMKIFFPIAVTSSLVGLVWGTYIALQGRGLSVGANFLIISGIIFFLMGLLAEQVSQLRHRSLDQ